MKPMPSKLPGVIAVAQNMQHSLTRRFKFVWDPFASNFDKIYIASTFLTPAYRGLLEDTQLGLAKGYLTDLMKEDTQDSHEGFTGMVGTDGTEAVQVTEDNTVTLNNTEEPPVKRFKHLDWVSELLQKKEDEEKDVGPQQMMKEEEEIERYSECSVVSSSLNLKVSSWARKLNSNIV